MNDNVIDMAARRLPRKPTGRDRLINLPPATLILLLALFLVQVGMSLVAPETRYELIQTFGFTPAPWSGAAPFATFMLATPLTYILLHGSWTHFAINGLSLAAFGAGVERWIGWPRYLVLFVVCGVAAAFAQALLTPASTDPVIGASGSLSGLFAAVIVMMHRVRAQAGEATRTLSIVVVWIGITVASGISGLPYGANVAWAAHLGGFAAGFAMVRLLKI